MFTDYQKEEIIGLIQIRLDTLHLDPDSGDHFETIDNLVDLEAKVIADREDYTDHERDWIAEELENRIKVGYSSGGPGEKQSRSAFIKSLTNAIDKIKQLN